MRMNECGSKKKQMKWKGREEVRVKLGEGG